MYLIFHTLEKTTRVVFLKILYFLRIRNIRFLSTNFIEPGSLGYYQMNHNLSLTFRDQTKLSLDVIDRKLPLRKLVYTRLENNFLLQLTAMGNVNFQLFKMNYKSTIRLNYREKRYHLSTHC